MVLPSVVDLGQSPAPPAELVGDKAASLARLASLGLRVPRAWAVTTAAFEEFCNHNGLRPPSLDGEGAQRALSAGTWPPELRQAISHALSALPGDTLAVRASVLADLGHRFSRAGQVDSFFHVPRSDVFDCICRCWASLFVPSVRASLGKAPAGSVVLQEQLSPDWSGVAFSLHPVTLSLDELHLEWTHGPGLQLIRGDVIPERLAMSRGVPALPEEVPPALRKHLLALHAAFGDLERAYQGPVDVEWCVCGETLFWLQAWPVTMAQRADHILWSSANVSENFPVPLAPLAWSFLRRFYQEYIRSVLRLFGWGPKQFAAVSPLLDEMMGIHQGRAHYNLTSWYQLIFCFPWSDKLAAAFDGYVGLEVPVRPAPDARTSRLRRRSQGLLGTLRFLFRTGALLLWAGHWLRQLDGRLAQARVQWRRAVRASSEPREADEVAEAMAQLVASDWRGPCAADLEVMVLTGLLAGMTERWCQRRPKDVLPTLLQGVAVRSDEPSRLLWTLGQTLAAGEAVDGRAKALDFQAWQAGLLPEARRVFEDFLGRFGARCYSDCNLLAPTFEEKPELVFELARRYAGLPESFSRASRRRAILERQLLVQELCRTCGPLRAVAFRTLVRLSLRAIRHREEGRFDQSLLFGEARGAFLKLGELLQERGVLRAQVDVFELSWEEARGLARGTYAYPEGLLPLVEERRRSRAAMQGQTLPRLFLLRAGDASFARPGRPSEVASAPFGRRLAGTAVSRGKARGRARLVRDPTREVLERGEILVATSTDPGWTPLLVLAGGIVLERGGLLSHAAIVAREFGIPGLVQVQHACQEIPDGATVVLDADAGTVLVEGPGA
jgi:rifampicin phosphotransferase